MLPIQYHGCGKQGVDFTPVTVQTSYTVARGYGWGEGGNLTYVDREQPDAIRRDMIAGAGSQAFLLDLPIGVYDLLVITGDQQGPTWIDVEIANQARWSSGLLPAGSFRARRLSFYHPSDGVVCLRFCCAEGLAWKLSALIINWRP